MNCGLGGRAVLTRGLMSGVHLRCRREPKALAVDAVDSGADDDCAGFDHVGAVGRRWPTWMRVLLREFRRGQRSRGRPILAASSGGLSVHVPPGGVDRAPAPVVVPPSRVVPTRCGLVCLVRGETSHAEPNGGRPLSRQLLGVSAYWILVVVTFVGLVAIGLGDDSWLAIEPFVAIPLLSAWTLQWLWWVVTSGHSGPASLLSVRDDRKSEHLG